MSSNINLLPNKRKENSEKKHIQVILWAIAVSFLFSLFLSAIVVFFIQFSSDITTLSTREKVLLSQIAGISEKHVQFVFLKDRLTSLSSLIEKRPKFDLLLGKILQVVPSETIIDSFSINKATISITMSTQSLLSTETALNNMQELIGSGQVFAKMRLNGITYSPEKGQYTFSIEGDLL